MAKITTPAMEKLNKKRKRSGAEAGYNYWADAWKRLKRNKLSMLGLFIIATLLLIGIFAPFIIPYSYSGVDVPNAFAPPSAAHIFGTDQLGRDVFSRCIFATRISLPMGFVCAVVAIALGGIIGLAAAFFMGNTDNVLMRAMDIFQAIPGTLMAICVVASLGTGIPQLILAIAISNVPMFAKTVRSAVLTVRDSEYIEATRTIGAKNLRLMFRHIIPNCVGHVIIFVVASVAANIMIISMMSYIGLGIQPPLPEWGSLLSDGKAYISSYAHMVVFPGLFIMITVFAFFLLGDGVRDALDPRLK
jgi:ABC-type dipeptide/oligopeptide/nickel transport system permease subunit